MILSFILFLMALNFTSMEWMKIFLPKKISHGALQKCFRKFLEFQKAFAFTSKKIFPLRQGWVEVRVMRRLYFEGSTNCGLATCRLQILQPLAYNLAQMCRFFATNKRPLLKGLESVLHLSHIFRNF